MRMLRIGLCHMDIGRIEHGGICTLYKNLAYELQVMGHEVHIVTARTGWNPSDIYVHQVELINDRDSNNRPLTTAEIIRDLRFTESYSMKVAEIIEGLGLDVAECSTWGYELLAYLKMPRHETKIVVRGDLSALTLGATSHSPFEKDLLHLADARVFVSYFARSDLQRNYEKRHGPVIHLGVDDLFFHEQPLIPFKEGYRLHFDTFTRVPLAQDNFALPADKITVVWVGKPTAMKGFDLLMDVIRSASSRFFFVVCFGHAIQRVPIEQRTNAVFLQDLPREDYARLLQHAKVFLTTSRWEGFGLAVLEAMASGRPIVFPSWCSALSEFIRYGIDGLSYTDSSEVNQKIAVASQSTTMGQSSRRRARQFTWQKNARLTAKLYERIVSKQL